MSIFDHSINQYLLQTGLDVINEEGVYIDSKCKKLDMFLKNEWIDGRIFGLPFNGRKTITEFINKTQNPIYRTIGQ